MGKVNDALNDYMNDPEVFADFCNGVLYGGRKVITPEKLAEYQKFYHEELQNRAGDKKPVRRERDVARLLCEREGFVIIAVENQDEENLYMPLRCMEYEVEDLKRQLRHTQRHYDREKDLKPGAEFLSGIKRTDRFIPTAQIVVYHGEGRWEAPDSLKKMMDLRGADETLKGLMTNYQIRVIHLTELDENQFETGLRELIGMMKCRDDRKAMQSYCMEHADRFANIDDATYDLICTMLHIHSLRTKKNSNRNLKGDKINMCKAFDDWAREEQEKGERRGEKRAAALMSRLIRDKRFEDADRAANSTAERKRLYLEYEI